MLTVVLQGLADDADTDGLTALIHDSTAVGWKPARALVRRLQDGDAVFLSVHAGILPPLLRNAVRLGVKTAEMMVSGASEWSEL